MNTFKKKFLTISIMLIVLVLNGYGATYSQPRSGDWTVPTEFGQFVFTVNLDGTHITKLVITYSGWTCGSVTKSGTISTQKDPPWPVSDNQFTIGYSYPNDEMTINGTFNQAGDEASGTWIAVMSGTNCSGDWEATFTDVEELGNTITTGFKIAQNYPNPFNSATTISYDISKTRHVELTIFNILGQKIETLVNCRQPAGSYQIQWDGQDNAGREVASGIYFYRLKAGEFAQIRKMILMK
jgi:hypothetical protein